MSERSVAEFFDGYSTTFDALYGNQKNAVNGLANRLLRRSMRLRFERTLQGCEPVEGRSGVDIGCGPGHYSVELARRGAARTLGIDFAPSMVRLAEENARRNGVADRCEFVCADFLKCPFAGRFDYAVVMGFMDYVEDPAQVIDKVLSITARKALFSFPVSGGFLAWQRKRRYKNRCRLFFYSEEELRRLFAAVKFSSYEVQRISRDFFVTVSVA